MISGEYWPGDITWFRGLGKGKFAKGEFLKGADGKNANAGPPWKSTNKPEMDSLAAAPWLVDWDADGDLDLLVGNISGHVVLLLNDGDRKDAKFVRKGPIQAGGSVLDAGHNDAGPTTVDWDGDGLWDLIVGSGNGSVTFFRNTGDKREPRFAAGVELIGSKKNMTLLPGKSPTRPGSRTKPFACDWNGDGQLDLLVGDYSSSQTPAPTLDEERTKRRDELQAKQTELSSKLAKLYETRKDGDEQLSAAAQAESAAISKEMSKLYQELAPLIPGHESHGYVWVYLRTAKATGKPGAPIR